MRYEVELPSEWVSYVRPRTYHETGPQTSNTERGCRTLGHISWMALGNKVVASLTWPLISAHRAGFDCGAGLLKADVPPDL